MSAVFFLNKRFLYDRKKVLKANYVAFQKAIIHTTLIIMKLCLSMIVKECCSKVSGA